MMSRRRQLLHWSSGIMLMLGVGHLSVVVLSTWDHVTGWVDRGMWAAVPLAVSDGGTPPTLESLQNKLAFWGGPGSLAVPLIILGLLIWHLADRGIVVPAGIGWGMVAWCLLGGVLLVPSPFFVGAASGVLIVLAARKEEQPPAA